MQTGLINYWSILACGIASMVLGFLWYGPVFGKMWMELMGWDPSNTAMMEEKKKGAKAGYVLMFLGSLVMAWVLSHSILYMKDFMVDQTALSSGLTTAFFTWLGFIATVTMGSVLWEGKSWKLWCFNNAYYLVQLLMFGAILTLWR